MDIGYQESPVVPPMIFDEESCSIYSMIHPILHYHDTSLMTELNDDDHVGDVEGDGTDHHLLLYNITTHAAAAPSFLI